MRKPAFCICENKDADQLRGNREADQRLCFRYMDSTIPLLPKSEISSLSIGIFCGRTDQFVSETPKTSFLTTRLIFECHHEKTTKRQISLCSFCLVSIVENLS